MTPSPTETHWFDILPAAHDNVPRGGYPDHGSPPIPNNKQIKGERN